MKKSHLQKFPDSEGFFGRFGGAYIPDVLKKEFEKNHKSIYET